jgi:hypothetical protein
VSKPRRVRAFITLPFLVYTFFIGWCLSWIGERKKIHTKSHTNTVFFDNLRIRQVNQNNVVYFKTKNRQNIVPKAQKLGPNTINS